MIAHNLVTFYTQAGSIRTQRVEAERFDSIMRRVLRIKPGADVWPYIIHVEHEGCL